MTRPERDVFQIELPGCHGVALAEQGIFNIRLDNYDENVQARAVEDSGVRMSAEEARLLPVGTWELVSLISERPDGKTFDPFGPLPSGRITYDNAGHVTAMIVGGQRNEASGQPCRAEAQSMFTAYFGTYRVDPATGEIEHQVTTSLNGAQASGELRRNYKMEDGKLYLWFSRTRDGVEVTSRLVWRRISAP